MLWQATLALVARGWLVWAVRSGSSAAVTLLDYVSIARYVQYGHRCMCVCYCNDLSAYSCAFSTPRVVSDHWDASWEVGAHQRTALLSLYLHYMYE